MSMGLGHRTVGAIRVELSGWKNAAKLGGLMQSSCLDGRIWMNCLLGNMSLRMGRKYQTKSSD